MHTHYFFILKTKTLLNNDTKSQSHKVAYTANTIINWLVTTAPCWITFNSLSFLHVERVLCFHFVLTTTGHVASLHADHHDQLGSLYEFIQLNEPEALTHWGFRGVSKFIVLFCFFSIPSRAKKHKLCPSCECFWRFNPRLPEDSLAAWEWKHHLKQMEKQERCPIPSHEHMWAAVILLHLSPFYYTRQASTLVVQSNLSYTSITYNKIITATRNLLLVHF